jgi:hypothetical protein
MNKAVIKTYAQIIHAASMNRHAALLSELAVGFAVLMESLPSKRLARAQLQKIYNDAGCKCADPKDVNWKGINRRISASIALFDFIGIEEVRQWAGDLQKGALIEALIKHLEPLKLNTVNEVLLVCRDATAAKGTRSGAGRRPGQRIETAHMKVTVPYGTSPEEMLEVAGKLMAMAQELVNARQAEAEQQEAERQAERQQAAAERVATANGNGNGREKEKIAA